MQTNDEPCSGRNQPQRSRIRPLANLVCYHRRSRGRKYTRVGTSQRSARLPKAAGPLFTNCCRSAPSAGAQALWVYALVQNCRVLWILVMGPRAQVAGARPGSTPSYPAYRRWKKATLLEHVLNGTRISRQLELSNKFANRLLVILAALERQMRLLPEGDVIAASGCLKAYSR